MVLLGMDYGRRRTGTALQISGVVLPGEPVEGGWKEIIARVRQLAGIHGDLQVVLGLPLSALGKPTEMSSEVEKLAERIRAEGYQVFLVNEVRSTGEAKRLLGGKDRKGRVDSVAACEILKRHLNII